MPAMAPVDDAFLRDRIHTAVCERGGHDRDIARGHVKRTLPRVDIGRLERIEVDPPVTLKQVSDALVALVGRGLGLVDLAIEHEISTGEAGQTVLNEHPLRLGVDPRREAGSGYRTRVYHRIGRAAARVLDRNYRIERQTGAVDA